jgi:hypothetical protein
MPSRPDLRELATNVKDAFADLDRETLLEILTFVVKEYVVEGPPPMLVHQAETLADLKGASFAQVIAALQTRFDHPELALFAVDGEQVSVRVGGVMQPLAAGRQPMQGAPASACGRPRSDSPRTGGGAAAGAAGAGPAGTGAGAGRCCSVVSTTRTPAAGRGRSAAVGAPCIGWQPAA